MRRCPICGKELTIKSIEELAKNEIFRAVCPECKTSAILQVTSSDGRIDGETILKVFSITNKKGYVCIAKPTYSSKNLKPFTIIIETDPNLDKLKKKIDELIKTIPLRVKNGSEPIIWAEDILKGDKDTHRKKELLKILASYKKIFIRVVEFKPSRLSLVIATKISAADRGRFLNLLEMDRLKTLTEHLNKFKKENKEDLKRYLSKIDLKGILLNDDKEKVTIPEVIRTFVSYCIEKRGVPLPIKLKMKMYGFPTIDDIKKTKSKNSSKKRTKMRSPHNQ
ncbi:MAG: hypothetical protein ACTSVB_09255 [Candidatus Heimdallarchaeaceae archaeon]